MNYIIKELLVQGNFADKINYKLSAMGSGKTTQSIKLVQEYLKAGKRVLMLTPYQISKAEYLNDAVIQSHLTYKSPTSQVIDKDASQFVPAYPMQMVEGIGKMVQAHITLIQDTHAVKYRHSISVLLAFREVVNNYFNVFDLVIVDEMDMLNMQGIMTAKSIGLQIDEKRFTQYDALIAILMLLSKSRPLVIAVSANKFPVVPKIEQNEAIFLSGVPSTLEDCISYTDTGVQSNQNISELLILSNINKNLPTSMVRRMLINGTKKEHKTILFSPKAWDCALLREGVNKEALIYSRNDNLQQRYNPATHQLEHICIPNGYKKLMMIDNKRNLSADTFAEDSLAMINLSSTRAVSITDLFETKSLVMVFADEVTAGMTQAFGRFRYTETQLCIVGNNLVESEILEAIKDIDPYLSNAIKKTTFIAFKGTSTINHVNGLLCRASETDKLSGKAVSDKTLAKRTETQAILQANPKIGFVEYKKNCKECMGKTQFQVIKAEIFETAKHEELKGMVTYDMREHDYKAYKKMCKFCMGEMEYVKSFWDILNPLREAVRNGTVKVPPKELTDEQLAIIASIDLEENMEVWSA